jgi:hypothetical protein
MAASEWISSNHSHMQTPSRDKGSHLKETDVQSTAKVKNQSQQWQPASGSPSNHNHMQEHANAFLPHIQRTKNGQSEHAHPSKLNERGIMLGRNHMHVPCRRNSNQPDHEDSAPQGHWLQNHAIAGDTEGFATTRQKRPDQSHHLHHQHIKGKPTKQAKDP